MLELLESQGKIISKPLDFHCMCGCTLLLVGGETLARSYHPKKPRWKPEIRSIRSPLLLYSSWCLVPKVPKGSLANGATVPVSSEGHHSNIHGFSNLNPISAFFFLHHLLVGVYCDVSVSCFNAFYMGVCRWNLSAFANPGTYSKPRCFEWQWLPCSLVEAFGGPSEAKLYFIVCFFQTIMSQFLLLMTFESVLADRVDAKGVPKGHLLACVTPRCTTTNRQLFPD